MFHQTEGLKILRKIQNFLSSLGSKPGILAGKKILIVDDGEIERRVYSRALESARCQVVCAADAAAGLAAARSQPFDLILLDFMLPDSNGVEVCKELKSVSATKRIPIIFLTGSMQPEGVITCYDAGADYYLSKPISSADLIKQVRTTLEESGRS